MRTLLTFILSITPLLVTAGTTTTQIDVVQLSAMGLILMLLVLYTFTWLFNSNANKRKVLNNTDTVNMEEVITSTLKLPHTDGNMSTSVKLLQSDDNTDTFIIVAKVDKKNQVK